MSELERRFEEEIETLVRVVERACMRSLPWAVEEHGSVVQEALERTLRNIRTGKLSHREVDLAGYVYGVAQRCIKEIRRALYRAELRACALPEDDEMMSSLYSDERGPGHPVDHGQQAIPLDVSRTRLLEALRYYVVHVFATATEKKRRQALRDTFILARHYLRDVPLADIAAHLGLTRRACQYAMDRTMKGLFELFDPETGDVRSFVENSAHFADVTELTDFLQQIAAR